MCQIESHHLSVKNNNTTILLLLIITVIVYHSSNPENVWFLEVSRRHLRSSQDPPPPVHPRSEHVSEISLQSFPYGHYAEIKDQDLAGYMNKLNSQQMTKNVTV